MSKIALITGASRGLGRSTAIALAEHGIDVVGTYHANKVEADSLTTELAKKGRKAAMLKLDTGDVKSLDAFRDTFRKTLKETFGREDFDFLLWHGWITTYETLGGFALSIVLGIPIAIALVASRTLDRALMPWLILSQTFPKVALAPLIVTHDVLTPSSPRALACFSRRPSCCITLNCR